MIQKLQDKYDKQFYNTPSVNFIRISYHSIMDDNKVDIEITVLCNFYELEYNTKIIRHISPNEINKSMIKEFKKDIDFFVSSSFNRFLFLKKEKDDKRSKNGYYE